MYKSQLWKRKVSEKAKKDLKDKMMKEYEVLTEKIEDIDKTWKDVIDKMKNFLKEIEKDIRYKALTNSVKDAIKRLEEEKKKDARKD